jgi:transcriptional regulator with XRE-family HTH domain
MKNLGAKIREERKTLGLTLEQMAELVRASPSMLQRIETGSKSPPVDLLVEIANIFRVPIDEFLQNDLHGFRKLNPYSLKTIQAGDFDVTILCPYGLISRDVVVSRFKGRKGALVRPQRQKGYCWVYIIKGSCVFEHDGISHRLQKGDSFYYDAERPHHLKLLSNLESIRITTRR